jgi:hypothetical protein
VLYAAKHCASGRRIGDLIASQTLSCGRQRICEAPVGRVKQMTHFIQHFMAEIGTQAAEHSADVLGIDRLLVLEVLPQVVPILLCGLKRQKDAHGGMDRIDHILNKYGRDHIFENLPAFLTQRACDQSVTSSLGGLLGNSGLEVDRMLSLKYKLDNNVASRIIPMLAPVVLGYLSRERRQSGIGLSGISAILDREAESGLLDDISASFLRDNRHALHSDMLAELLKGLTAASH